MEDKIYFDNGSTSWPKAPGVAEAMAELLAKGAFNINRGSYEGAYEVENIVLDAREKLARLFHAPDSRYVVFSPGITYQSDSFDMPQGLPDKYESGTMNLPRIIGLHAALSYIEGVTVEEIHRKKMELTAYFLERIREIPGVRIAGRQGLADRVAVVSLDFVDADNAVMAFELEANYGIMTRVGLHCAPLAHKSLHTYPQGTVRFAFSASNTKEEIDICAAGIRELLSV